VLYAQIEKVASHEQAEYEDEMVKTEEVVDRAVIGHPQNFQVVF
jgi:hypothetical protein